MDIMKILTREQKIAEQRMMERSARTGSCDLTRENLIGSKSLLGQYFKLWVAISSNLYNLLAKGKSVEIETIGRFVPQGPTTKIVMGPASG